MLYRYNESMLDTCVDMFLDIYTSSEFNYSFLNKENVSEYFKQIYAKDEFEGFVYTKNKKIIAVCLGKTEVSFGSKMYEITEICVENEYRGKGVGKAFMKDIETFLRKEGYVCINLSTKRTIDAYEFYLKNGFTEKQNVVSMMKAL